jgi:hypothetical protein
MAHGFELVLQACGIAARPGLVAELVRHNRDMPGSTSMPSPCWRSLAAWPLVTHRAVSGVRTGRIAWSA